MKRFFSINRRLVEILLSLLLVVIAAAYYYLIYIPAREDEIIARRFRTLQRIEKNIQEKYQGYIATVKNCLSQAGQADDTAFVKLVDRYNTEREKFSIRIAKHEKLTPVDTSVWVVKKIYNRPGKKGKTFVKTDTTRASSGEKYKQKQYDSVLSFLTGTTYLTVKPDKSENLKKILFKGNWYLLNSDKSITHIELEAIVDYREFIRPLLKKNTFDQYIVFNVKEENSSVVYESFPSGISFKDVDSLFDAKEKVYSSRVIKIETAGIKYLAFLHPCGYGSKNDRIIAGLYREDAFTREKQKLPDKMVTTILFIALFTFLLLPFMRLLVMGKKDRIKVYDVIAVYFSFVLLLPAIVLVFLWNKNKFLDEKENSDHSRQELAKQISGNFIKELNASYYWLDKLDQLYSNNCELKPLNKQFINYLKDSLRNDGKEKEDLKDSREFLRSLIIPDHHYRNIQYAMWLDSATGKEMANWSFENNPPRGNYKDRQYFKNANSGNIFSLPGDSVKNFAIEPHISRIDGKFKIAIAKKSACRGLVVAAPCIFGSINNPVLPLGFTFTITDAFGNTVFDSDPDNNLNENLLEELSDSASLQTVLQTRNLKHYKSWYKENEFYLLSQPIDGLPWFITIFETTAFDASLNAQTFSFSLLVMLCVFLLLFLEILIIFITSSRNSRLHKNKVDLLWIHPKECMSSEYFFLGIFNACMLVFLSIFCLWNFSLNRITEYTFLIALTPILTALATLHYNAAPVNKEKQDLKHSRALWILGIMAALLLFTSLSYGKNVAIGVWIYTAFSIILYFILPLIKINTNDSYLEGYKLMIFSRTILTGVLPVVLCFKSISLFEHHLQERLRLVDFARKIDANTLNSFELNAVLQNSSGNSKTTCYTDSEWVLKVDTISHVQMEPGSVAEMDSANVSLLKSARIRNNEIASLSGNFDLTSPLNDKSYRFNNILNNDTTGLEFSTYKIDTISGTSKNISYFLNSSGKYQCQIPVLFNSRYELFFWILLLGVLVLCYFLLGFGIEKIFGKSFKPPEIKNKKTLQWWIDDIHFVFINCLQQETNISIFRSIMANKNRRVFYECGVKRYNAAVMDFRDPALYEDIPAMAGPERKREPIQILSGVNLGSQQGPETFTILENAYPPVSKKNLLDDPKVKCILFTHFEFNNIKSSASLDSLRLLENFAVHSNKKIVILSSILPSAFLSNLHKKEPGKQKPEAVKENSDPDKEAVKEKNDEPGSNEIINRWTYFFSNMVILEMNEALKAAEEINQKEHGHNWVAKQGKNSNGTNITNTGLERDAFPINEDTVLNMQKNYEQLYLSIWNNLSKEEQLLLLDIAEDGLVNTLNREVLEALLQKELVYTEEGIFYIVNSSFKNFILGVSTSAVIKNILSDINGGSSWGDFKIPVLIVLAAIIYFVLISNPEKFGSVLPYISGIMAGIPTIIKIISSLKHSAVKT